MSQQDGYEPAGRFCSAETQSKHRHSQLLRKPFPTPLCVCVTRPVVMTHMTMSHDPSDSRSWFNGQVEKQSRTLWNAVYRTLWNTVELGGTMRNTVPHYGTRTNEPIGSTSRDDTSQMSHCDVIIPALYNDIICVLVLNTDLSPLSRPSAAE